VPDFSKVISHYRIKNQWFELMYNTYTRSLVWFSSLDDLVLVILSVLL
jgi:hypothetical protein